MNTRVRFIDRLSSGQDHLIFAGAFVIGGFWVLLTRVLLDTSVFVALLVPVAILLLYAWFLWQPQFRLREDRAGDNLYYLGFLFTVVSLGIALYRYDGSEHNVNSIINDMGVGLSTTVIGLFLRIFYSQLRLDPEEMGQAARIELTRGLEQFRTDVLVMNQIVRSSQHALRQDIDESKDEFARLLKESAAVLEDVNQKFRSIDVPPDFFVRKAQASFSGFEVVISDFAKKVNDISIDVTPINNQVSSSAESMKLAILNLVNEINGIDIKQKEIFSGFARTVAGIENSLRALPSSIEETNSAIESQLKIVKSTLEVVETQANQLLLAANSGMESSSAIEGVTKKVQELVNAAGELKSLNASLVEFASTMQSNDAIKNKISHLASELTLAKDETVELTKGIESITSAFANSMQRLVEATDTAIKNR